MSQPGQGPAGRLPPKTPSRQGRSAGNAGPPTRACAITTLAQTRRKYSTACLAGVARAAGRLLAARPEATAENLPILALFHF